MAVMCGKGQTRAPQAGTRRHAFEFRRSLPHLPPPQPDGLNLRTSLRLLGDGFQRWLGARNTAAQWAVLLVFSVVFAVALEMLHLPAALMLGPMIAAILLAVSETRVRVPGLPFFAAQAVIGALIARGLPASIVGELQKDWLLFAAVILLVVAVSTSLGWLLARWQVLPGTTAIWGASPGAATAMVLMSDAYGADMRLVAFMQYQRVVFVATLASVVSAALGGGFGRGAGDGLVSTGRLAGACRDAGRRRHQRRARPAPAHPGRRVVGAARSLRPAAGRRTAQDRAAALAVGDELCADRLEHRPALYPRHPGARRARHAGARRRGADPDRACVAGLRSC